MLSIRIENVSGSVALNWVPTPNFFMAPAWFLLPLELLPGAGGALLQAANFVQALQARQGLQIANPEEIAFGLGWISREVLLAAAERLGNSSYGQYLLDIAHGR